MVIQHKGYIETVLHLQHEFSDSTVDVIHFWFTGWHFERVPTTDDQRANTVAFVRFVTAVRKASGDGMHETTVVHCDTGVGRTGTYVKFLPFCFCKVLILTTYAIFPFFATDELTEPWSEHRKYPQQGTSWSARRSPHSNALKKWIFWSSCAGCASTACRWSTACPCTSTAHLGCLRCWP